MLLDFSDRDAVLKVRREFMDVTQNLRTDFRDYLSLFCVDGEWNGQTRFFRHYRVMRDVIKSFKTADLRILAAPASIGCEAYSLARLSLDLKLENCRIDAFDISQRFTDLARLGAYPTEIAHRLERQRDEIFASSPREDPMALVRPEIRERVHFLPPQKFQDFKPDQSYDIVLVGNLFCYLEDAQIQACLDVVASTQASVLIFTQPKKPVRPDRKRFTDIRAIHPAWRSQDRFSEHKMHLEYYAVWARRNL